MLTAAEEEERAIKRAALRATAIEMMSDLRRYREERAVARNRTLPKEEFTLLQEQISLLGRLTLPLHLERFLRQCDLADSLGPMVDPTLYRDYIQDSLARANLEAVKAFARALLVVRTAAEKLVETMAAAD